MKNLILTLAIGLVSLIGLAQEEGITITVTIDNVKNNITKNEK